MGAVETGLVDLPLEKMANDALLDGGMAQRTRLLEALARAVEARDVASLRSALEAAGAHGDPSMLGHPHHAAA